MVLECHYDGSWQLHDAARNLVNVGIQEVGRTSPPRTNVVLESEVNAPVTAGSRNRTQRNLAAPYGYTLAIYRPAFYMQ